MKWSYIPPYGYACCPHCRQEFNLEKAQPTFLEKAPHNDVLVYVMCPDCHAKFQKDNEHERKVMANACFVNVKSRSDRTEGGMPPYAMTSTLTLALNDWLIPEAIENGHGLTRAEYFSICSHVYEVSVLPGGLRIISTSSLTGVCDE